MRHQVLQKQLVLHTACSCIVHVYRHYCVQPFVGLDMLGKKNTKHLTCVIESFIKRE